MPGEFEYDELLMTLVESALAQPKSARQAFLQSNCNGDTSLYREALSRVDWQERMGGFLCDPVVRHGSNQAFAVGDKIGGRFRIVRELGRGGMGVVYEAVDEKLDRRIALKSAQRGFQDRLSPEARSALEVSHPNVCKLHEIHTAETPDGPIDFLTMEFVEGENAAERIRREGPLPATEVHRIALQLCAGLAQAHSQGVVHGDLKCGNVILSRTPEGSPRAVLTDFGLARLTGKAPVRREDRGGTPDYMAPELLRGGPASTASDIYALGVVFHVLLKGHPPSPPLELPAPWDRILPRCLAETPEDRFESAEQITAILSRRPQVVRWLLAFALAIIAALGLTLWLNREKPGPPVRLAVLPAAVEGSPVPVADGVVADVAERLSGLRRNFTVLSPAESSQVDTPAKARSMLGATHALSIGLRSSGSRLTATASITDAVSGHTLRELEGEYSMADPQLLAKALLATVTRTFGLKSGATQETVSPAAYTSYVQGVGLLRRDTQSADRAIPFFEKAIALDARSALPWAGLAEAQLQKLLRAGGQQWSDAASVSLAKAKSINPDSLPVLMASGVFLQAHGKYEQAIADFTRATELEPSNSEAWRRLAVAYEKSNRTAEAVSAFRKAIEIQPDDSRPYESFGSFYLDRNQFAEAEKIYRRVTEVAPVSGSGHMNLGLALMQQAKFAEAEKAMLTALQIRPTALVLMNLGALYYAQERYRDALRFYEKGIAAGPPSARRYRNLGSAYRHLGLRKQARDAYTTARNLAEDEVARNPRQAYSRVLLALLSAYLGDARRAEVEIAQALSLEPENATVMREAAIAFEFLGRRGKALQVIRQAPPFLLEELTRHPDMKRFQQDSEFKDMLLRK